MYRTLTLAVLGTALVVGAGVAAPANASSGCTDGTVTSTDLDAGCTVGAGSTVVVDGRTFVVPAAGTAVRVDSVSAAGAQPATDVTVFNTDAGVSVQVGSDWHGTSPAKSSAQRATQGAAQSSSGTQAPATAPGTSIGAASCAGDYNLAGNTWRTSVEWRYNEANSKGTYAYDELKAAANKWGGNISACGASGISGARNTPLGATGSDPAVTSALSCSAQDNKNVIGWGSLPTGTLAATCTFYNLSTLASTESDQKYSTRYAWNSVQASCSGDRYDVRGVAVHEWGHTFGLDHVDIATRLVMKPSSDVCELSQRSLGYGDFLGIIQAY
ncbi:matrixin family metalloprotease [Curtobacterium flaccumfaciens]|uniref:matrixin family metalloprotease n=1 Tax=Curtobacterium flaccumfaciens TaxID=2035 RepID=UPI00220D8391|nr:matrixin family metalloprotease [Curtobacterium flaccumfaciens]UWD83986.1 matrixin family metalloprotease [Curtobacterium flaccumfaciens]